MKVIETAIPGVLLLKPQVFSDARGFFLEIYNERAFAGLGLPDHFVQDNQSHSNQGVLRGLHYQCQQAQGKLVRVLQGEVFDVAVDLRPDRALSAMGRRAALPFEAENDLDSPRLRPRFSYAFGNRGCRLQSDRLLGAPV
jgi:dTDP-4-dehydrorhamnose 3,5-epimerase